MRHKHTPTWFPMYIDKWLLGSTRHELTHEERAIWTDLMALSKKDQGFIRASEGVPYPYEQLAGMFMSRFDTFEKTLELVSRVIEKCLNPKVGKLKLLQDGTLFVLSHEGYLLSDRWERELNKRKPLPNKWKSIPEKRKSPPRKRKSSSLLSSNIFFSFSSLKWEGIKGEDIEAWKSAYPACDVEAELKKMAEWLKANPTKKKSNYRRFIQGWLSRQQDRGGSRNQTLLQKSPSERAMEWAKRETAKEKESVVKNEPV